MSVTITGALIKLTINNKSYNEVQSLSFDVDYGEAPIFGIDTAFAQELAPGQCTVRGTVSGLRIKLSGGLQAKNMRPLFTDLQAGNYISLKVTDRSTSEDIVFIPSCKISTESHSVSAKGVYKLNFSFVGQIPFFSLDRS